MNLMIVINSMSGGGAERVTAWLSGRWASAGRVVTVVTLADEADHAYRLEPGVRLVQLGVATESKTIWEAVLANLKRLHALRTIIRREQPLAVVGMMSTTASAVILASIGLRVRVLAAERASPDRMRRGIWRFFRALTFPLAAQVVAQTRAAEHWFRRHTAVRRVSVISNAVAWPLPEGLGPVVGPDEAGFSYILAVGRLDPVKGFNDLLEVFAKLAPDRPEWRLVLLGDGPLRDQLAARAAALHIGEKVQMPGRVANVSAWYEAAQIFALSSHSEGFPNVLLEAMASGLPCVSFDCDDGPAEMIVHGENGLLIPARDITAFTEGLASLMDDGALRERLGAAAQHVRERFSSDRIFAAWEAAIGTQPKA